MIRRTRHFARSVFCGVFTTTGGCLRAFLRGDRLNKAERRLERAEKKVMEALGKGW